MDDGFYFPYEDVLNKFNVNQDQGLNEGQVKENQAKYGPN
ncbi:hypothetical protein Pmani_040028, partial [Petrolisthes manimaculis]